MQQFCFATFCVPVQQMPQHIQRNLTRAAEALNLTQSVVSNSLKLLREHFHDEILIRDGRSMRLTEFGESLRGPLEEVMAAVRRAVAPEPFDPATSRQRFRIATADYVMAILAPHLTGILSARAPAMAVQMLNARKLADEDLRAGRIDMLIAPQRTLTSARSQRPDYLQEVSITPLLSERLVCIGRIDDHDLRKGLTAKRYWQGGCPLTGITDKALLRASHIVPWKACASDAERLDVHNGLLLSALWDAAFDRGLVTFDDGGIPQFSPSLSEAGRTALQWQAPLQLTEKHRKKLAWHRANLFVAHAE